MERALKPSAKPIACCWWWTPPPRKQRTRFPYGRSFSTSDRNPGKVTLIRNKADLSTESIGLEESADGHVTHHPLGAHSALGLELLREHLKACMGFEQTRGKRFQRPSGATWKRYAWQGRRWSMATAQLIHNGAGELLAEDLRQAQQHLGEITGAFTPRRPAGSHLLRGFCIGK